jgi:hypothetical protein
MEVVMADQPTDTVNELLDYVPGLREYGRQLITGALSRRLLTYAAAALLYLGFLSPDGQDDFINDNLERVGGFLLEGIALLWALSHARRTRVTLQAAVKSEPDASIAQVAAKAQAIRRQQKAARQGPAPVPETDPFFDQPVDADLWPGLQPPQARPRPDHWRDDAASSASGPEEGEHEE